MEPWQRLDAAGPDDARRLLFACCGSTPWVERMLARRPFGNLTRLLSASEDCWRSLPPDDWREAFGHHPKIGERDLSQTRFAATRHLSEAEQAGVADVPERVLQELAEANRQYEARFGYVFIICATGRTAPEMLGSLRSRLTNDPAAEIRIAAAEQARITALRLTAIS